MIALQTKLTFKSNVRSWVDKLDVRVNSMTVRPMRNKWASCSTNGNLTFNGRLLDMDREMCDYVIVHELLHFFVPNHGKLWKSLMMAHLGDYQHLEQRLRSPVGWMVAKYLEHRVSRSDAGACLYPIRELSFPKWER